MLGLLDKHSYIAIVLAVALEELGIPMPIPTDLLIVFAGVKGAGSPERLAIWFVLLNVASALGASGLYAIVRRGGRPLVDRFGRYVHLGPQQLTRAENLLTRGGWTTIAVARAIPGLRYLAVVGCGLLNIPYWRFLTAHIVGSSVYIGLFLWLGSLFGPAVLRYVHLPAVELRLVWLLLLAIGLPALLAWLCYRGHAEYTVAPSRRRTLSAILLASFAGATAMAASWAAAASLAEMLSEPRPLNVIFSLANDLLGRGLLPASAYMLVYSILLALCIGVGAAFYEIVLPLVAPRGTTLVRQALGLILMVVVLVCAFLTPAILAAPNGPILRWWRSGSPPLLALALLAGIISYAFTTTCARALAIAILPSLRRSEKLPVVVPPSAPSAPPSGEVSPAVAQARLTPAAPTTPAVPAAPSAQPPSPSPNSNSKSP